MNLSDITPLDPNSEEGKRVAARLTAALVEVKDAIQRRKAARLNADSVDEQPERAA